ncbi:MAG: hypothetical protein ACJAZA_001262 [Shewanella psychromarinicola]|jgi:hypothetical protein
MNSHHHQPLHYLPVRHYIRCGVVVTILTCSLVLSTNASANNKTNLLVTPVMAATNSSPMETITVIYRNPFDYALYQQTTEILLSFNLELSQSIPLDAQQQSRQMAAEFGFPVAKSAKLTPNDKILLI